jgi:hypothetical protein
MMATDFDSAPLRQAHPSGRATLLEIGGLSCFNCSPICFPSTSSAVTFYRSSLYDQHHTPNNHRIHLLPHLEKSRAARYSPPSQLGTAFLPMPMPMLMLTFWER